MSAQSCMTRHFLQLAASAQRPSSLPVTASRHLLAPSGGSFSQFPVRPKCPPTTSVSLLCCSFFSSAPPLVFCRSEQTGKYAPELPRIPQLCVAWTATHNNPSVRELCFFEELELQPRCSFQSTDSVLERSLDSAGSSWSRGPRRTAPRYCISVPVGAVASRRYRLWRPT